MQIPCVERPPASPPIRRQGQIASQLQASRYVPDSDQDGGWLTRSNRTAVLIPTLGQMPRV